MKIATWNVNGIRARETQFQEWVATTQPDVICLQEIKASIAQVPESICNLGDYWCYWHGAAAYSGVALHMRRETFPEEPKFTHPDFDHETRIVEARAGDTVFASVYVPNGGKDYAAKIAFMNSLIAYARMHREQGLNLVICGDYNVARTDMDVHPKERKPNIIGQRPEERDLLEVMIAEGLVDVGRKLYPDADDYFTWWAPWRNLRQRNIGWRLDYVLASESLAKRAVSCPSFREIGTSDHAPVVATFE
ncbi:MAG TPA: exodeoxyribonuclease III [Thermoanaerobaculia bacterium]|jgi:exodeoxyribonuclease-3|nr:exodeoxyribonuclease III [Thermoanaerobaculia bacterium]